jgi:hypothetical protein
MGMGQMFEIPFIYAIGRGDRCRGIGFPSDLRQRMVWSFYQRFVVSGY